MALSMIARRIAQSLTDSARVATLSAVFFFTCAAFAGTAFAARSAWVETVGGGIRLVTGARLDDGTLPAMLEIRLEPGWRTYWSDPGSSGIPPEVTITATGPGSKSFVSSGLRLPAPKRFAEGDLDYAGYDQPVAFPLLLKTAPGAPEALTLEASVFLGICKSICIPVQATLDVRLSGDASDNPLDTARVRSAFAALPAAPRPDFNVAEARFDAAGGEIALALTLPHGATLSDVFLAAPSGYVFRQATSRVDAAGLTQVRIAAKRPAKASGLPAEGAIRATISVKGPSGMSAIETPLVFKP
ncbi:DsbC/DsbD-like thiol-disulfide interchange protein [Rhizobium sp. PP-F2F-G48]|nr:DsbC/DsbD-like thiol-disulfide interchange protein [Rhizobium sp. PP-F2F-G48]